MSEWRGDEEEAYRIMTALDPLLDSDVRDLIRRAKAEGRREERERCVEVANWHNSRVAHKLEFMDEICHDCAVDLLADKAHAVHCSVEASDD